MRFEEVSPPVESRIFSIATVAVTRLSEELKTLLGLFIATRHDENGTIYSADLTNVTAAAKTIVAPGGLTSLLLTTAILLRVLRFTLVQSRAARLLGVVSVLADNAGNNGEPRPKND